MSTAVAAVLCRCGHAERMHERDDAEPDGRGACMQRQCGCSGLRPGEGEAPPEPAASEPVAEPDTRNGRHPFRCDEHDLGFATGQGLGAHNRHHHPKLPAAAKQGSPGQRSSSAAAPSVRPDNGVRPAPSGTATTGEAVAEPREMRPAAGGGAHIERVAIARYSLSATFVLANEAGTVDFRLADATEAELFAWLPFVTNLPPATEGATTA